MEVPHGAEPPIRVTLEGLFSYLRFALFLALRLGAAFFLALRLVVFFFTLRLATGALRLVTFRFLAALRFEVFLRDFFLVAIAFSVSGFRAEYIQRLPKIQQVT